MSLSKPEMEVEYGATGTSWSSLASDVMEFEARLSELKQGVSTFQIKLDNTNGLMNGYFPATPDEQGLQWLFRLSVNGVIILAGRSDLMAPEFSAQDGDVYVIEGKCLGQELLNKYAYGPHTYSSQTVGTILEHQQTEMGWNDVQYSKPDPDTTLEYTLETQLRKRYVRDVVAEMCEALDYEAWVDSRGKPATLLFFPKNDPSKRLNVVLQSILYSQENNILRARIRRDLYTLKNRLYLEDATLFTGTIPSDGDAWTEATSGWTAIRGSLAQDSGFKVMGGYSIRCRTDGMPYGPQFWLDLEETYGLVDVEAQKVWMLNFNMATNRGTNHPDPCEITIYLFDSSYRSCWKYLSMPHSNRWGGYGMLVGEGYEDGYEYVPEGFDWKISRIEFYDRRAHTDTWNIRVWVDYIKFSSGVAPTEAKIDWASDSKYGTREKVLQPPEGSHNINLSQWGDLMLDKYSKPLRVINLTALIDPATVELAGGGEVPLAPGYSLQVDIPRWSVMKVAYGGVYWRILEVMHRFNTRQGYTVELDLAATEAETTDYSHMSGDRYLEQKNVLVGALGRLIR